jgi:hypothetical protein
MRTSQRFGSRFGNGVAALAALVLAIGACGTTPPKPSPDGVTTMTFALMTVPSDVLCLEVTVAGSSTVTQRFDVTPGTSALITMKGIPTGMATVDEKAYGVACNSVTSSTAPTWVAAMAQSVTLAAGTTTDVAIVLKRPPQLRISNDFQDSVTLTTSPALLTFGTATVGAAPLTQTIQVTNTGTVPAIFAASMTGSDGNQFTVTPMGCPATGGTMQIGASCTLTVSFAPTTAGPKTATLSLGQPAALLVPVSGMSILVQLTMTPPAANFGSLYYLNTPAPQTLTVYNTGTVAVPFAANITGADMALFSIVGTPTCGASIPIGGMCTVTISHTPSQLGARVAQLNLGSPVVAQVPLTSTVISPITAMPSPVAFNNVSVGTSSNPVSVTVTNLGTAPIPFGSAIVGADAAMFTTSGCPTGGANLGPGTCVLSLKFSPTGAPGARTATVNLGSPVVLTTLTLNGTGTAIQYAANPMTVAFGALALGQQSAPTIITVQNTGLAPAPVPAMLSTGDISQFVLTNTCPLSPAMLPQGGTCTMQVKFAPNSTGLKSSTVAIGAPPVTSVTLSGTGANQQVSVTPSVLAFGDTMVGGPGSSLVLQVNNTGLIPATVAPAFSGTDIALFTMTANNCPGMLAAGSSCALTMKLNVPVGTATGLKNATVNPGGLMPVAMTANVVSAQTVLTAPATMDFGQVVSGAPAVTQILTLTNTSTAGITASTTITGTDAASFTITSGACVSPLAPGSSCTVAVRFSPTSPLTAKTAQLVVGSPQIAVVQLAASVVSAATVTATPPTISFPSAAANATNGPTVVVTIANPTGAAVAIPLSTAGPDGAQFVIQSTTCAATLAAGANCTATLRFAPTSINTKSGVFNVGAPILAQVTLSGTGT